MKRNRGPSHTAAKSTGGKTQAQTQAQKRKAAEEAAKAAAAENDAADHDPTPSGSSVSHSDEDRPAEDPSRPAADGSAAKAAAARNKTNQDNLELLKKKLEEYEKKDKAHALENARLRERLEKVQLESS